MDSVQDSPAGTKSDKLLGQLEHSEELAFEDVSKLLSQLRILTRERSLSPATLEECIRRLIPLADKGHTEAQKCLSNLIMNYEPIREKLVEPYVNCAEQRLRNIIRNQGLKSPESSYQFISDEHRQELLYYDLRIIFLLSAMCSKYRHLISEKLSHCIIELLRLESSSQSEMDHQLINEGLKALFNLTLNIEIDYKEAKSIIKQLFSTLEVTNRSSGTDDTTCTNTEGDLMPRNQLLVNLIHLMTNMPEEVYKELSEQEEDMILSHLQSQLISCPKGSFRDNTLPVLNVCSSICKYSEKTRKRWFEDILGSTEGFERRPEEYDDFRGRLVKLMTSVDVHIKDLAADFLYSLCARDTEKFITYTGFGNSAAFLSSRGLLTQSSKPRKQSAEDSKYQELRDKLNPITGKIETAKRNPMEGLSEEEKEYHAEQLANAITKLSNLGVIKPMCMRENKTSDLHPDSKPDADKS